MNRSRAFAALLSATAATLLPAAAHAAPPASAAARCEALSKLKLADTRIVSAALMPGKPAETTLTSEIPAYPGFCRVVARVEAAPDSDIGVEIWLPADNWAGVFHGNGNGGFAGTLAAGYGSMAEGLRRGFATAVTDTGTAPATSLEGDALIGHPRKWRDWGRLSTHVMTEAGKAITKAFYGRGADRSYYTGCSTGGQQGLIEALYYPADYDGILVGAPVIDRTWGHAAVLWDYQAAHRTPDSMLSPAKLKLLNQAAVATCWQQGKGIAGDPFITDPMSCNFDPAALTCTAAASDTCLTPAEVTTARAFYSGPTDRSGKSLYYGWLPGSEVSGIFGWSFLQAPIKDRPPFGALFNWVFGADWNWRDFDFDRDMPQVDEQLDPVVNDATRGSLAAFAARGGKLVIYHGLADTLVAPGQSVAFYQRQAAALGEARMADSTRLFLAPGMMHCGGGSGPDSFNATLGIPARPPADDPAHDIFSALIDWREKGREPRRVIATKYSPSEVGAVEMQRPLCPYPQKATYKGWGSTRAAGSFVCS